MHCEIIVLVAPTQSSTINMDLVLEADLDNDSLEERTRIYLNGH
jgi:hypothetical protein